MQVVDKVILKPALIRAGFWGRDEAGDPARDEQAAAALIQRIEKRLGQGAYLFFCRALEHPAQHEVRVNWGNMTSVLARSEDLCVAICEAALELPSFLQRHPECAASDSHAANSA